MNFGPIPLQPAWGIVYLNVQLLTKLIHLHHQYIYGQVLSYILTSNRIV